MSARWMIERKYATKEDILTVIEVYAPGENKELVKKENKKYTHKRELIITE